MQVVILAGGKGTRLYPYTVALPKPLVPVGGRPILDILLRQLKRGGATEVVISTGHLSSLIRAYVGNGAAFGLPIHCVEEDRPLNTAGPLALLPNPADHFLVVNGDVLTTLDYGAFLRRHRDSGAVATVGLCRREARIDFGVVTLAPDGRLEGYAEKPGVPYLVSMGVNAFSREALARLQPGEALGMPDFFLRLKSAGGAVRGDVCDVEWLDIGRPEDFEKANRDVAEHPTRYQID